MMKEEIQLSIQERKLKIAEAKIDMVISSFYRVIKDDYEREQLELKLRAIK